MKTVFALLLFLVCLFASPFVLATMQDIGEPTVLYAPDGADAQAIDIEGDSMPASVADAVSYHYLNAHNLGAGDAPATYSTQPSGIFAALPPRPGWRS